MHRAATDCSLYASFRKTTKKDRSNGMNESIGQSHTRSATPPELESFPVRSQGSSRRFAVSGNNLGLTAKTSSRFQVRRDAFIRNEEPRVETGLFAYKEQDEAVRSRRLCTRGPKRARRSAKSGDCATLHRRTPQGPLSLLVARSVAVSRCAPILPFLFSAWSGSTEN